MISNKMEKMTAGGSSIRSMFEEGKRLSAIYGSENVYDFSLGNPNVPAPEKVRETIVALAENTDPVELHGYMSNAGFPDVRRSVAESLNRRFGTSFSADSIIMTAGAAGGMNVILKTLLNPGDEVLVFSPYFLEYANYVSNYDGVLIPVPADEKNGFQPSGEALGKAVTPRTKALIINNPNNPTGAVYSEDKIKEIAGALEERQAELGTSIYIISDEPYRELVYDGKSVPFITKYYRNTIVAYSWSKSLSLPGERIGYLAVSPDADDSALISNAAVIANRILGFVNAPSLQQKLAAECLEEPAPVEQYDSNRKLLYETVRKNGFECLWPEGAFYLWVKAPDGDDLKFAGIAKEQNILIVPGTSFGCPGYARLAYCVDPGVIVRSAGAFSRLARVYGLRQEEI